MSDVAESQPIVSDFIASNDYWRIDCLGSLSFADRPFLDSQPTISVAASKAYRKPTHDTCWRTDFTNTREQCIEKIPIALFPNLRHGDFWRSRRLALSPKGYQQAEFFLGEPQLLNSTTVRLGDPTPWSKQVQGNEKREYLLPYFQHPYHRLFTRAFCELFELPDGTLLLIPHWEIIRFYFGSSTQLIETLFDVRKTIEDLVDSKRCKEPDGGHAHLHLRAHLPYNSVEDVSRIYFCPKGRQAFNVLRNSLSAQAANGEAVFPKTVLPVEKPTKLIMKGRFIKYQNGNKGFICYELTSCSAPFPYSSLTYFKDMPGDKNPDADQGQLQPMTVRHRERGENKPKGSSIRQEDANTLFGTTTYELPTASRFPYLDKIPRGKLRVDPYTHYSEPGYIPQPVEEPTEGVGHGGKESQQSAKIVLKEHALHTSESLSVNFKYFFAAVEQMMHQQEIYFYEYISPTPDRHDSRCTVLPIAFTEQGRESKLCYIDYIKGRVHTARLRRRAVVTKITYRKGVVYLLEAEERVFEGRQLDKFPTFLVKALDSEELAEREIQEILQAFSSNERIWKLPPDLNHILSQHIRHPKKQPDDTTEIYIDKLCQKFIEIISDS